VSLAVAVGGPFVLITLVTVITIYWRDKPDKDDEE
jgi:hypothetical protein